MTAGAPQRALPAGPVLELASRIYVELIARNMKFEGGAPKLDVAAEALASLSVKLAESFLRVEDTASAARTASSAYELNASSFAQWSQEQDGRNSSK
jgi:hypothetical protein